MIELRPEEDGRFAVGFGGDTLNTAVYLARFGAHVDYITQLGDDTYSEEMLAEWSSEGVGTQLVRQVPGRVPGLYVINNDASGERFFTYWRNESPARELFDNDPKTLFDTLLSYDYLYLSGISLSLYNDTARDHLFSFLDQYREQGGHVVFDVNYRPANWPDVATAQQVVKTMLQRVDTALPSFDDEQVLFGFATPEQCLDHYQSAGVATVVLKDGLRGCTLLTNNERRTIPVGEVVAPIDTTAAGDSFNAGFLAAITAGKSLVDAVDLGQQCAALVIQHPGAVIDRSLFLSNFSQYNLEAKSK